MERSPNLRQYAAFRATIRHGSLSKAARAVNLSQPALTQAISGLEATLGVSLFVRGPSGMLPTEPALLLAQRVEAALDHVGSNRVTGPQLRAFQAVARHGSYAAAAEQTGLTPPSIHRAVADLQVTLGQRLVERRGWNVVLTHAGQRRARGFGLAVAELRAGRDEVAAWRGSGGARLTIGAMPLCRARWLPQSIARFREGGADVELSVVEGSYGELIGPLRDGDIDFILGALRDGIGMEGLSQNAVFDDFPAVVMRAGHPLCGGTLSPQNAAAADWVLPGAATPLRRCWEAMLRDLGVEPPRVTTECGSVMMIRQLLLASDSLTLLSPDQVSVEVAAGLLVTVPPPAPIARTIGIVARSAWQATSIQKRFVQALEQVGRAL